MFSHSTKIKDMIPRERLEIIRVLNALQQVMQTLLEPPNLTNMQFLAHHYNTVCNVNNHAVRG